MTRAVLLGSRTLRSLLVVSLVLAVAGAVAVWVASRESELDRARQLLDDDAGFSTASGAGRLLNRVSIHLQDAGEACGDGDACAGYFTAAGAARVSAVRVLACRRPEVFAVRNAFRDYLDALGDGAHPSPPSPPTCS